jgi:hypothetical protein
VYHGPTQNRFEKNSFMFAIKLWLHPRNWLRDNLDLFTEAAPIALADMLSYNLNYAYYSPKMFRSLRVLEFYLSKLRLKSHERQFKFKMAYVDISFVFFFSSWNISCFIGFYVVYLKTEKN